MKNYYEILGIQPGSNEDEIKSAYREKARKFHPDTSNCDNLAEFLQVQEAYETLGEPEKRTFYDTQLQTHLLNQQKATGTRPARSGREDWNYIQNDFFNLADWHDEENANHKFLEITLSPQEASQGTIVSFEIPFAYTCPFCLGTGEGFFHVCSQCRGTGRKKLVREFHLKLAAGQKDGNHLTVNLIDSTALKMRLNIVIKVLNSATIFSEIF